MNTRKMRNTFLGHRVARGDMLETDLKVSETVAHQPATVPVTILRGPRDGPVLFVTSAVHGDEINGVAIVRRLLDSLDGRLERGTLLAVPVANRFGFESNERYLPDRRDLNRHFPGEPLGHMADRIAHALFRHVVRAADAGIDLHTAADGNTNLCHVRGDARNAALAKLMHATGVPILVDNRGPKGSLRRAATEAGIPTLLFEAGEPGRFQRHAVEFGHHALLRLLAHHGMVTHDFRPPAFQAVVRKTHWLRVDHGGILDLHVEPGDLVRAGQTLGAIVDPFGRHVDGMASSRAGVVLSTATDPLANPGNAVVHVGEMGRRLAAARSYVQGGGDLGHVRWKPQPPQGKPPATQA